MYRRRVFCKSSSSGDEIVDVMEVIFSTPTTVEQWHVLSIDTCKVYLKLVVTAQNCKTMMVGHKRILETSTVGIEV